MSHPLPSYVYLLRVAVVILSFCWLISFHPSNCLRDDQQLSHTAALRIGAVEGVDGFAETTRSRPSLLPRQLSLSVAAQATLESHAHGKPTRCGAVDRQPGKRVLPICGHDGRVRCADLRRGRVKDTGCRHGAEINAAHLVLLRGRQEDIVSYESVPDALNLR